MKWLVLVVFSLGTLIFAGCSGGGGGDTLHGVANLSPDTESPRVAIFILDFEGGLTQVRDARMNRSTSEFANVPFSIKVPDGSFDATYVLGTYNDLRGTHVAVDSELLGLCENFVVRSGKQWLLTDQFGTVLSTDATKLTNGEIFIPAVFSRGKAAKLPSGTFLRPLQP